MSDSRPKRIWRLSRRIFRWVRVFFLFVLFLAVFAVVYLHEIGVPEFVKRPVLQRIHEAGFNVEFTNMRWAWPNHILIENPRFSKTNHASFQIFADTFDLNVHQGSAAKRQLRIESMSLKSGRVILPLSQTNNQTLILTNITAAVRVSTNHVFSLDKLSGEFDGATVQISGAVTNYPALLDWQIFQPSKATNAANKKNPLQQFVDTWHRLKFSSPPDLVVKFSGDATSMDSIAVDTTLSAKSTTATPWGKTRNLVFHGSYAQKQVGDEKQLAEIAISTDSIDTPHGKAHAVDAGVILFADQEDLWRTKLSLSTTNLDVRDVVSGTTNLFHFQKLQWHGSVTCTTNLQLRTANGQLQLTGATSSIWGATEKLNATLDLKHLTNVIASDENWAFWQRMLPWQATWTVDATKVKAPNLEIQHAMCEGEWLAPNLLIRHLETDLYDGKLSVDGNLDIQSRKFQTRLKSDFDIKHILPLLPEPGQRWLKKFSWEKPPELAADIKAVLPSWTNHHPDWQGEVLPTVDFHGSVSVTNGSYRSVPVASAHTDFAYSNLTWTIPNLRIVRSEGEVDLSLSFNKRTKENHWTINSTIDPKAIRNWFPEDAQAAFDKIHLGGPPKIHAEISERGFDFSKCGIRANVEITNVTYGDLSLDLLRTSLTYTNQFLALSNAKLEYRDQQVTCPNAEIDFKEGRVFLHEVYSTMEPMPITRAIGKKVAAAIEPYHFHKTPTVYVDGNFVFDQPETADMHFIVEGEQFEWGLLKAEKATGKVDWIGEHLYVTNINATAYRGGTFEGWVFVDFAAPHGNDFKIGITFTNLDLHTGMLDLGKTNKLEGTVDGKVNITAANTKDDKHWEGFGWMQLHDGLIWEVPIFGIFSPLLNAVLPGSGSSRARDASATFIMTNSVIRSDDLEIRSTAVRINYKGTVDFSEQVNAKVEAQFLRDAGSLGHLFSIAMQPLTKIFEYRLTGTLDNPESEPVFIPNILMKILRPFDTLKKLLPDRQEPSTAKPEGPIEAGNSQ